MNRSKLAVVLCTSATMFCLVWLGCSPSGDMWTDDVGDGTGWDNDWPAEGTAVPAPANFGGDCVLYGDNGPVAVVPPVDTDVQATITGYVARVHVTQTFTNTQSAPADAVYRFPLPPDSAVDGMTLIVDGRRIEADIMTREDAEDRFNEANQNGQAAALLNMERPNVFTQQVANIPANDNLVVELTYTHTLELKDGVFSFHFPTIVAQRYKEDFSAPLDDLAPMRQGDNISIAITLDAGMTVSNISSPSHTVTVDQPTEQTGVINLTSAAQIPNEDFLLLYRTGRDEIADTVLVHADEHGKFMTLILQPPARVPAEDAVPKELVFVLDTSGSMQGDPIELAKDTMGLLVDDLNPNDRFNIITFSGDTHILWDEPRPGSEENITEAQNFLASRSSGGGTEMMTAIRAALEQDPGEERMRVVVFMTDGQVGNDYEIIEEVKQNAESTRVFSFGIGGSPNRFLLDHIAWAARGESVYLLDAATAQMQAQQFYRKIDSPVLADIEIDFGTLAVTDVYPAQFRDLFSETPIMIHTRLTGDDPNGTITVTGRTSTGPYSRTINVDGVRGNLNASLPSLWARAKVEHLMNTDLTGLQTGQYDQGVREQITQLGLEYSLVTPFTSFVAVDDSAPQDQGDPQPMGNMGDGGSDASSGDFGATDASTMAAACCGGPGSLPMLAGLTVAGLIYVRRRAA